MCIDTKKVGDGIRKRKRKLSDVEKLSLEAQKHKYRCNCGHSVVIYPFEKKEKKICSWCRHYVYKDKEIEFKEKLTEEIKRKREYEEDSHVE